MRRLLGLPLSCSASQMFVGVGVRGFWEVMRANYFSAIDKVNRIDNGIIKVSTNSDVMHSSTIRIQ